MNRSLILAWLPASSNGLSFRGSETALFTYMFHSEKLLGHKSILCLGKNAFNEPLVLPLFESKFPIVYFENETDLENQLLILKVDALYSIRAGPTTGLSLRTIPMLIHCVYEMEPIGNELIRAGVSPSVSRNLGEFVPHMVSLDDTNEDYRSVLGIPKSAIVFGRHGGNDTFNIDFIKDVILRILKERENIYFLFAVRPLILQDISHPRLICLECFADPKIKRKFINTVDSMLHAQTLGETWGLAIAEMSAANKPVIVWDGGRCQEHLRILGDKCIKYNSSDQLYKILTLFDPVKMKEQDWKAYQDYSPEKVMKIFDSVFLYPLRNHLLTQS